MKTLLEICAADIDSVYAAARGGADRVELCCALSEGGLTPPLGMLIQAIGIPDLKINVLLRPRSGDFIYSDIELQSMWHDTDMGCCVGVNGFVFGALTPEGDVDKEACRKILDGIPRYQKTFHRAFDMCRNPRHAVRDIIELGFDRILTSGQAPTAMEGAALIRDLQKEFPEITFIAAGGITPDNAAEIVRRTGVREIHASAKTTVQSRMSYRNPTVSMGTPGTDEFARTTTSGDLVAAIKRSLM